MLLSKEFQIFASVKHWTDDVLVDAELVLRDFLLNVLLAQRTLIDIPSEISHFLSLIYQHFLTTALVSTSAQRAARNSLELPQIFIK